MTDLEFMQQRANETGKVMGLLKVFVVVDARTEKAALGILHDLSADVVENMTNDPSDVFLAAETEYAAVAPKAQPAQAVQP